MKFLPVIRRLAVCVPWFVAGLAVAGTPGTPGAPGDKERASAPVSVREIWVPAADLDPILAHYPRAVPLDRGQLFTLLRDAHAADPTDPATVPPERAVLRQALLDGRLPAGPDANPPVSVTADLEVETLSDAWADVPLGLPGVALGTAEIDTPQASLRRADDGLCLRLRGRGLHRLQLEFVLPVETSGDGSAVVLPQVAGVGGFTLHLPVGAHADSPRGCAVQPGGDGVVARVSLARPGTPPDRLSWRAAPPAPAEASVVLQDTWVDATVEAARVAIRQQVTLRPALGHLPREARLGLPAGARAVRVENAPGGWDLGADGLRVALAPDPAEAGRAAFTVAYDLPLPPDGRVTLPLLQVTGAHGVRGGVVLSHGLGMQVRRIEPGPLATPSADGVFPWYEQNVPGFVAGFNVADLPAAGNAPPPVVLTLEARPVAARFSVDADVGAEFRPEGVAVRRTLTFHVEEGTIFSARVRLPPGETFLALRVPDGSVPPEWRQEDGDLFLAWNTGLAGPSTTPVVLETRADLPPPRPDAPTPFALAAALVPGAERLTGYVALTAAPALRLVTTGGEERLERRDGRTTPVRGDTAWFYRDDFRLALRVERRAAEAEARFTGYALPLAGAVEVHAQLDYHFLYSGVETVKIRVPSAVADAFFFTGPNIAERRREGDVWTIRFQGEQRGDYALGVQATIPAPADKDDPQRFHFRLPAVVPLDVARWSGAWAVEANTDTEIRFTVTGASEVDALHAPPLAGYQPSRRIIAVYEFTGGPADAAVDLEGVRHPAAAMAAAVVDRLDLETFASTSGVARHRATLRARTAADGFFNLRLPAGASLWSLTRDGAPVKPVGGAEGKLCVELPGGRTSAGASTVVAIYETPGQPWAAAGRWQLAAPGFDPDVPVLQSRWQLYLPDGFDYRFPARPLGPPPANAAAPGDLLLPRLAGAAVRAAQWLFYYPQYLQMRSLGSSGIADPRHVTSGDLPDWMKSWLANERPPVSATVDSDAKPVPGEPVQELILPAAPAAATPAATQLIQGDAAITRKLAAIIIPDVEFRGTTISDAIEYLRQESRRLDTEPDVNNRGVNLFLKLPAREASPIPGLPDVVHTHTDTHITLTLHDIPLLEALKYVASQAGLKVKVEPYAVSMVPVSEQTDVMVTADFRVPPGFFGDAAATPGRQDARTFLEASGVTFPPGASATYLPGPQKLIVRNTQENVDLVQSLASEPPVPSAPLNQAAVGLKVAPSKDSDGMVTAELTVAPGFLGHLDAAGVGTVTIARQDAKTFLEASGVAFPPGASATYLPSTGKLVVRNSRANLDLLAALAGVPKPSGRSLRDGQRLEDNQVAGLLPIRLDLPANGQRYDFAGGGRPGALEFRYADWRNVARWRWILLTLGASGFLCLAAGWTHPWRRTWWIALALTFFPLVVAPASAPACNALLAGWLWAVLGWAVTRFLLRRRRLAAVLLLAGAMLPAPGRAAPKPAAPPGPSPAPTPETVIVPYDATRPVADQTPTRFYLPYERFLDLWDAAKRNRQPPAPPPPPDGERYDLSAARYDARLSGETLEIDAAVDFQTFGDGWVAVPLRFDPARPGTLTLDGVPAALDGKGNLWVGTPGAHRVNATLQLPAGAATPGTGLSWSVPPTAATRVTLLLPRADRRVELRGNTPGGGTVEETVPGGRRVTASLGGTTTVELAFREVPPPAPASGQPALARIVSRLVAGSRQETLRSEVTLAFPGTTQDHFTVYLDPTLTLTDLDAPDVRQWRLGTGGDRQTLELTLRAPARDGYRLVLSTDRPLPALPAARRAFPVVSAAAGRIEQTAALRVDGAVEITLPDGSPPGLRRVPDASRDAGRPVAAFEGNSAAGLVYTVRATEEKRAARIDYLYQVGRGKVELAASVRLVPAAGGAPLLAADLRLPAGFAVQAVAGEAVRQWWRDGDTLSLRLAPVAAPDGTPLVVYLVRQFERAPDTFALQPITAVRFAEVDGETVVAADRSFRVGLTLPAGVRARDLGEIDPAKAAAEFQVKSPLERQRAFRYRGAGFDVSATLEVQPARSQAQWVTRATVREGLVALETHVNVGARQGAVDAVEFTLPAGLAEARVSGADVRETVAAAGGGNDRRTYRVLWQNPLYAGSESDFTISLELPLDKDGRAALPELRFPGGSVGGFLLIENASDGEMTLDPRGLDPAVETDVPFLPAQIVAGTRFFRVAAAVPWSLGVRVTNLEKTAGRAALVAYAELTSTLRAGGEEWHRATYRLQNRRLQFLSVELPPGTEFIGARVAGESVRVDAGTGGGNGAPPPLLVPLLRTRPGELSYDVELVYHRPAPGTEGRESWLGHWQLADPRLSGVPVEKTLWNVYLPPDAHLLDSGGNVEPVVAALTETEKLESALYDLRSLSATYGSGGASNQERQRALSNFKQLADTVKGAESSLRTRDEFSGALLKQANAASQNAMVSQKKESIRRELDSLSAANNVVQDIQVGRDVGGVTLDQNRTGAYGFSEKALTPDDTRFSGQAWRDNRAADQKKPYDVNGSIQAQTASPARRAQLSLNDSLAVDLPGAMVSATTRNQASSGSRADAARVMERGAAAPPRVSASEGQFYNARPQPPSPPLPPAAEPPRENLRAAGRISLAVDFPQEGPVYHFEKLKADARLTLWSARSGRFAPLGWLGLLLAGWAAVRLVRWAVSRRTSP